MCELNVFMNCLFSTNIIIADVQYFNTCKLYSSGNCLQKCKTFYVPTKQAFFQINVFSVIYCKFVLKLRGMLLLFCYSIDKILILIKVKNSEKCNKKQKCNLTFTLLTYILSYPKVNSKQKQIYLNV